MKIVTQVTDLKGQYTGAAIALGTFDGVHIGHQKIIRQAVKFAKQSCGASIVLTFSNHPLSVISPSRQPPQLTTAGYKAELIAALGVDVLLNIPFTKDFLRLAPQEFVNLLVENIQPSHLVVGPNYSYGYKSSGTPETLSAAGLTYGFKVLVHPAVYSGEILVSSTTIRRCIQHGQVKKAALLLGRPFRASGTVVTGDGRGSMLGFPTANIGLDEGLVFPGDGVYAVKVRTADKLYNGLANVGSNPTFNVASRRMEVHVLQFTGNLYGQRLRIDFLEKIRDEITFNGVESLKHQISQDLQTAQNFFR
jgi:riboflavin kinase/FMN adenylyltransferase